MSSKGILDSSKERPVLFSGPMVRAILDDQKTQTRRVIKPRDAEDFALLMDLEGDIDTDRAKAELLRCSCPYGKAGDRLWVKERYALPKAYDKTPAGKILPGLREGMRVWYPADGTPKPEWAGRIRASRFMPRWASRITLEIAEVRVQRLQEITEADAATEGAGILLADHEHWDGDPDKYRKCFRVLWESIHGAGSWDLNPWLWAVTFKRVDDRG